MANDVLYKFQWKLYRRGRYIAEDVLYIAYCRGTRIAGVHVLHMVIVYWRVEVFSTMESEDQDDFTSSLTVWLE